MEKSKRDFNKIWEKIEDNEIKKFKIKSKDKTDAEKKNDLETYKKQMKLIEKRYENLCFAIDAYEYNFNLLLNATDNKQKKYYQLIEHLLNEHTKLLRKKLGLKNIIEE